MKKGVIIGAGLLLLLLVGGVGAFILTRGDSGNSTTEESTTKNADGSSTFAPVATVGSSYEATYTYTAADGIVSKGVIAVDANGNSKYSGENEGASYLLYMIDGDAISCSNDTCYKVATGQTSSVIDADDYEYTDDDFADFQNNAAYKGTAGCPAGTCSVWEITGLGNRGVTMYLDNDNRISKVTGVGENGSYEITYSYKDVNVTAPANVTELPSYQ